MSRGRVVVIGTLVATAVAAAAVMGWFGWKAWRFYRDPMGVAGGVRLVYNVDVAHPWEHVRSRAELVQRTVETVRQRLATLSRRGTVQARGGELDVSIPNFGTAPPVDVVKLALSRSGRLEFRLVDDGSPLMEALVARVRRNPTHALGTGTDTWTEAGTDHQDPFLTAPTRELLEQAVDELVGEIPPMGDHELLFERREGDWRSYYVFAKVHLDNRDIEEADVRRGDNGRPEVALDMRRAEQRLAALTEPAVGHKLAIVFEGRVVTAPVLTGKIPNGRVLIKLGSSGDPFLLFKEAEDLVTVLRMRSLPAPIKLLREETVAPRR